MPDENVHYCPVDGCDYGEQERKSLTAVRSHVSSTRKREGHDWDELAPTVKAQADEQDPDDDPEGEEPDDDDPDDGDDGGDGEDAASAQSDTEDNDVPTDDEYQRQRQQANSDGDDGDDESDQPETSGGGSALAALPVDPVTVMMVVGVAAVAYVTWRALRSETTTAPAPDPQGDDLDADQGDGGDDVQGDEQDDQGEDPTSDTPSDEDTMGDLYARMLVNLTNGIIAEHGHEDAEEVSLKAAKQAKIDHHFDRLMDEVGMGRDLPPGQAVMLSSAMFVGGSIVAHTDVPQQAASEFNLGL